MKAIVLEHPAPIEQNPLKLVDVSTPQPASNQVLVKISACGLCHTDLDQIEGRITPVKLPIVLGHQIVGTVTEKSPDVSKFNIGDRIGITWLNRSCGKCKFCTTSRENLCPDARWTGKDADGGYAQYTIIDENFAYPIPSNFSDVHAAPLLCAGVIGYRALRLLNLSDGQIVGLFGFGASAHIVIQVIKHKFPNCPIFVFTRSPQHRELAETLGAAWTGSANDKPSEKIDRAIDFTPIGGTIPTALEIMNPAARLVINTIRKIDPVGPFDYTRHLWMEKQIISTANVTRQDALEFLPLAAEIPIIPEIREFELVEANQALNLLKNSKLLAAAVLRPPS